MTQPAANSVVVVDDSEIVLATLRKVFEGSPLRVRFALSGEEALRLFEAEVPAVLLSDYRMPGMDGLELIERVKSRYPAVKCLIHTGEKVDRIPRNPAIVVPVLGKPVADDVLRRMVAELAA